MPVLVKRAGTHSAQEICKSRLFQKQRPVVARETGGNRVFREGPPAPAFFFKRRDLQISRHSAMHPSLGYGNSVEP